MLEEWKIDKELYEGINEQYDQTSYDGSQYSIEDLKSRALSHPLPFAGEVDSLSASDSEYNRIPVCLHFNPITNELVGYASTEAANVGQPDKITSTARSKYVMMDMEKENWVGTADGGSLVPVADSPIVVNEYIINAWCHNRIQRVYKYFHQLNILRKTVSAIVNKVGLTEEEAPILAELYDLEEFIKKMQDNNDRYIAEYIASPAFTYYSKDEWDKLEENRRAGELGTKLSSLNQITVLGKWESIAE